MVKRMNYTLIPVSSLRVTGTDRLDFLQGQMSNHLKNAAVPGYIPALFLNVRGQMEYLSHIFRREQDVYLQLPAEQASALAERFRKYIIFDQVTIEDVSDTVATVHVWGEALALQWAESSYQSELGGVQLLPYDGQKLLVAPVNRTGTLGLDVHILRKQLPAWLAELQQQPNMQEVTWLDMQIARVEATWPDLEMDQWQGFLPQECGFDYAISYKKGCYIGQEIMARLEARGNTRYHLRRLQAQNWDGALASYSPVMYQGKEVGRTGYSAGATVLARIRKDIEPVEALTVLDVPAMLVQPTET